MKNSDNRILLQFHYDSGLYTEEDDHGIYLYHESRPDNCIAAFGTHADKGNIWNAADKYLIANKENH